MIGVLAHLVLLGTGYAGSWLFAPPEPSSRALMLWGWLERRKAGRSEPVPLCATAVVKPGKC